jgi:hypothetical protein
VCQVSIKEINARDYKMGARQHSKAQSAAPLREHL